MEFTSKTLSDILKPKTPEETINDVDSSNYVAFLRTISQKMKSNDYKDLIPFFEDSVFDCTCFDNRLFNDACKYNCADLVKIMLKNPNLDPSERNNYAVRIAYYNNCYEVMDLLIKDKRVTNNLTQDQLINLQIFLDSVLE
jgi:hypothetical protein